MTARRCWTCNTEHALDAPCGQSLRARSVRAAGGNPADDLFDGAEPVASEIPVKGHGFPARYPGECAGGDEIEPGEVIVGTDSGWMHVECVDG